MIGQAFHIGKNWPVGIPAKAKRRGWCPHQPQY